MRDRLDSFTCSSQNRFQARIVKHTHIDGQTSTCKDPRQVIVLDFSAPNQIHTLPEAYLKGHTGRLPCQKPKPPPSSAFVNSLALCRRVPLLAGGVGQRSHIDRLSTKVQGISFVGYTGFGGGGFRLWNLPNLCPVPPYCTATA